MTTTGISTIFSNRDLLMKANKMKKVYYFIPLLIAALLLCSCGGNGGNDPASTHGTTVITENTAVSGSTTGKSVTSQVSSFVTEDTIVQTESGETSAESTAATGGYNIAVGSTTVPEPGHTVDPFDIDGDGFIDIVV